MIDSDDISFVATVVAIALGCTTCHVADSVGKTVRYRACIEKHAPAACGEKKEDAR